MRGVFVFYDRFIELCKERGVSPSAVMVAIGLNKSNATFWKKGSIPKGDTLRKLADYFGVSIDYLLNLTNEDKDELQAAENLLVEQLGEDRESVRKYLLDEKISDIPHDIYNQAIESADEAVVEIFKGVPDAQLKGYILESYGLLSRRGRIEAVIRVGELSEDYRFKRKSDI